AVLFTRYIRDLPIRISNCRKRGLKAILQNIEFALSGRSRRSVGTTRQLVGLTSEQMASTNSGESTSTPLRQFLIQALVGAVFAFLYLIVIVFAVAGGLMSMS